MRSAGRASPEWGFNEQVASFRWVIEQVIVSFKAWWVMRTDYRRPLNTFTGNVMAVTARTSTG